MCGTICPGWGATRRKGTTCAVRCRIETLSSGFARRGGTSLGTTIPRRAPRSRRRLAEELGGRPLVPLLVRAGKTAQHHAIQPRVRLQKRAHLTERDPRRRVDRVVVYAR